MKKYFSNRALFFIIPSFIGVSIFILIPFIDVIIRSFQNEVLRSFVGLNNYKEVFTNDAFKIAAKNTIKFVFVCIPLLIISSLIIAVVLQRFFRNSEKITTAFLVPMAIPIASIVLIWKILFNSQGIFNNILNYFNIESIDFMNSKYAFWVLVVTYIWKNLGYTIILWIAALSIVPKELYEVAKVDGASESKCFTKITFPIIKPSLYTITVLSLLNSFKVFREAYLIAGNYPHESMYMLQHIFNNWFRNLAFGKLSAASVVMAVVTFILIILLQRSWEREN